MMLSGSNTGSKFQMERTTTKNYLKPNLYYVYTIQTQSLYQEQINIISK